MDEGVGALVVRLAKVVHGASTYSRDQPFWPNGHVWVVTCRECGAKYRYKSVSDSGSGPMAHYEGCLVDAIEAEEMDKKPKAERDAIARIKGEF